MRPVLPVIVALVSSWVPPPCQGQAERAQTPSLPTLAERLGYRRTDKALIINIDDVALSHASNAATLDALEHGLPTSASIMVPAPWFPEIAVYARAHPEKDFGLHLTHTSEWQGYRWRPVAGQSAVPGLVDAQGYLWQQVDSVYAHATPEEAEREARAQIQQATAAGIDITHLDSHMGTLFYDRRYVAVYARLARDYDLPVRLPSQDWLEAHGLGRVRQQLAAEGIVSPDYLIFGGQPAGESVKDAWSQVLRRLQPGVTEIYIHVALPSDEMRAITGDVPAGWQDRAAEYRLFTRDTAIRDLLRQGGVRLIGYRALRDLQRRERAERLSGSAARPKGFGLLSRGARNSAARFGPAAAGNP